MYRSVVAQKTQSLIGFDLDLAAYTGLSIWSALALALTRKRFRA
jgi:hypothetical protein